MLKPIVGSAVEKVPSRYSLVIGIAKRARQIVDEANAAREPLEEKPVGVAVEQFTQGKFEIVSIEKEPEVAEIEEAVEEIAAEENAEVTVEE